MKFLKLAFQQISKYNVKSEYMNVFTQKTICVSRQIMVSRDYVTDIGTGRQLNFGDFPRKTLEKQGEAGQWSMLMNNFGAVTVHRCKQVKLNNCIKYEGNRHQGTNGAAWKGEHGEIDQKIKQEFRQRDFRNYKGAIYIGASVQGAGDHGDVQTYSQQQNKSILP